MQGALIAAVASVLMAGGANAYVIDVDVCCTLPGLGVISGSPVTIDLTLTTEGAEQVGPLGTLEFTAFWDPAVLKVAGSDPGSGVFGNGSQTIFPGLAGSENQACPNTGDKCVVLSQLNPSITMNHDIEGSVVGQLVLEVMDMGGFGLLTDHLQFLETGSETASAVNINLIPEPTTAVLIGLGLVGLGVAGRRS